ncbi:hypothetical protein [Oculatella sp. LEGE 06141]|nr:hypothetical protein [Oculatella sp. LEGE 06141]
MGCPSRYWQLVGLDGKAIAKAFFQQLWQWRRSLDAGKRQFAE